MTLGRWMPVVLLLLPAVVAGQDGRQGAPPRPDSPEVTRYIDDARARVPLRVRLKPGTTDESAYSARSAMIGSTRAARRAGSTHAATAMARSDAGAAASVTGS